MSCFSRRLERGGLPDEVRVIYVSPLKALSADIHRTWPSRAAESATRRGKGYDPCQDHRGSSERRHARVRAGGDAQEAAAYPGHDTGVAVTAAHGGAIA